MNRVLSQTVPQKIGYGPLVSRGNWEKAVSVDLGEQIGVFNSGKGLWGNGGKNGS